MRSIHVVCYRVLPLLVRCPTRLRGLLSSFVAVFPESEGEPGTPFTLSLARYQANRCYTVPAAEEQIRGSQSSILHYYMVLLSDSRLSCSSLVSSQTHCRPIEIVGLRRPQNRHDIKLRHTKQPRHRATRSRENPPKFSPASESFCPACSVYLAILIGSFLSRLSQVS